MAPRGSSSRPATRHRLPRPSSVCCATRHFGIGSAGPRGSSPRIASTSDRSSSASRPPTPISGSDRVARLRDRGLGSSRTMKGVILAGGTGSRLDPLTRVTNKHLLPVYDRPMVMYAIDSLREAGVSELMVVTGGEHVDDFRRLLGDGLAYGNQERPGGIAEALGVAREFSADD